MITKLATFLEPVWCTSHHQSCFPGCYRHCKAISKVSYVCMYPCWVMSKPCCVCSSTTRSWPHGTFQFWAPDCGITASLGGWGLREATSNGLRTQCMLNATYNSLYISKSVLHVLWCLLRCSLQGCLWCWLRLKMHSAGLLQHLPPICFNNKQVTKSFLNENKRM